MSKRQKGANALTTLLDGHLDIPEDVEAVAFFFAVTNEEQRPPSAGEKDLEAAVADVSKCLRAVNQKKSRVASVFVSIDDSTNPQAERHSPQPLRDPQPRSRM
jgi:hypothetical protein